MSNPAASSASAPGAPLAGFTVGLTADRRRDELAHLLVRRGARVLSAPAISIVPLAQDTELLAVTRALVARAPDVVVAMTGIGMRGWLEASDGWGLGEALLRSLGSAVILARGPKAVGALRTAGLTEQWSPDSESSAGVLARLLASDLRGRRVAVQLHGAPQPDFTGALRAAGAEVLEAPVYRWVMPADPAPLTRLLEALLAGQVDGLAFTSAPAVTSLLMFASDQGLRGPLLERLRADVLMACIGPVCALPVLREGLECVVPERSRLGALVRLIAEELPARAGQRHVTPYGVLELRSHAVLLDGRSIALPAGPMAVLRALADARGRVLAREELLQLLPGSSCDPHALESVIGRLRAALGTPGLVRTVVKRGYRLDLDPRLP